MKRKTLSWEGKERNVVAYILTGVLLVTFIWGIIGWHRVRELQNEKEGFQITQFEPVGGNPYDR